MTDETDRIERAAVAAVFGTRDVDPDELLTEDERENRDFAASLFSHAQSADHEPASRLDPMQGNRVAREGSNPAAGPSDDAREFVRSLFSHPA